MRRFLVYVAVSIGMLALPAWALAGPLTLHPSGFGDHSYSSWKAHEGLPDTRGGDAQALYFQKMTATTTFAAGVAVIRGLEGTPASELTGLGWDHRVDGHCGAGAPRWNVNLRNTTTGQNFTVFLGCYAAAHAPTAGAPTSWCRDTHSASAIQAAITAIGQNPANLTLRNLVIVFDEGTDNPIPQPPGCPVGASAPGFVFLDNITVELDGEPHVWTSANDNGNGQTIVASSEPLTELLDDSLASLF
jgi:hypothetical protein